MSFNWCFIGTGKIANKVAKEVVSIEGHQIVSCYNRTKSKAESFAKIYHSTVYESALEAINDPRVDGVYIATTNDTHFSFAKLCLENHKPVLVEKPITGNAKELKELIKLSKENETFMCEAMWTWFNLVSLMVKGWLNDDRVGKIKSVDCRFTAPMLGYLKKGSRLSDINRYGGVLLDLGVYPVRYIYELFGKPKSIKAKGKLYKGIDVSNETIFEYDGFKAKVISRMDIFTGEYCIIKGKEGKIKVPFFHKAWKAKLTNRGVVEKAQFKAKKYAAQFDKVAKDIKEGKLESDISLRSSLEVMEIMDEIRKQIGVIYPCDIINN